MSPLNGTIPRTCLQCGREFLASRDQIWRGNGRFCSRPCARLQQRTDVQIRFWARVNKTDGCWLWTGGTNRLGYGRLQRGTRGEGVVLAHRLSWEFANGPIRDGLYVCHRCDVPACVRPDHLFLGTDVENKQDMTTKGRLARGSRVGNAKLTEASVLDIRRRYAAGGITQLALAAEYGVRDSTICRLVRRRHWDHLT